MRFIRSVVAVVMFAAIVVVSQAGTAVAGPIYTGPPPIVDGYLDPLYASSFSTIDYTQTGASPSVITGQIAVIETADAYYIGFQQSLNRQSNAYCADKRNTPGCYHVFRDLVGSDHISFEWADLGGKPVAIGVDIITANANAQYGYSGMVKTPLTGNIGEGDRLTGCTDPHGVTGYSGEDWNWHHAGGTGYGADPLATTASPNYAGTSGQYPDYNYTSTAEVRIDKALCGIPGGLDLAGTVGVVAHNSPASPLAVNPAEFLVCAAGNPTTGTLGAESVLNLSTLKFDANGNTVPNPGRKVLASIASGSGTISSVNGVAGATSGVSDAAGTVAVGVTSSTAGTVALRGVLDLNGNGLWDQPAEPSTNPTCPIAFAGSPPISVDLIKTNDADGLGSYSKAEVAPSAGAAVPFHLEIRNPSTVSIKITGLTDTWPGHGIDNVCSTLINQTLAPYDAATGTPVLTCDFTVAGYAPAAGAGPKVNTAHVDAVSVLDPAKTASDEDTSSVTVNPGPIPITVDLIKTNNADGNAPFSKSEVAPTAGAAVPFHLEIRNPSTVSIKITGLTDTWPGHGIDNVCSTLINQTLAPYNAATGLPVLTCDFTVAGYAPAAGAAAKVNTAHVAAVSAVDPTQTAFDDDTSAVTVNPVIPPVISVELVKTNDANGDGQYNDAEMAPAQNATVPFKAIIHNLSSVPVRIDTLTDAVAGLPSLHPICAGLIGTTLQANGQPGDSQTCLWSEANYAPAPTAGAKLNIAAVTVSQIGDPTNTASDQDTSAVTSPNPGISVDLVKTNDADGDGNYHDAEVAPAEGAGVPFRAVITNTSNVAVQLLTLTDEFPAHAASAICANLVSAPTVLQPGAQVTCNWTESGYAWAPNLGAKLNVARVTVGQVGNLTNTAGADDSSAVTTTVPQISVGLVKTNDADGDGNYHDAEVAPAEGADVPFRAVITNTSNVAVRIDHLTDLLPGHTTTDDICAGLIGTVLQPGATVTCEWTEAGYAGAAGTSAKVNVAAVEVSQVGHPTNTANAQDTSAVTTAVPQISVTIVKTNDADRDGNYHDAEVAPAEGADVPFRAVITNTSNVAVRIDQLTDLIPGSASADAVCASLIGTVLQPGASATCEWTEAGYAGAPDAAAKVNTATVVVSQVGHPDNSATADDTSAVTTSPAPPVISITVAKTNDANGDGVFTDDETANAGSTVTFRAVITNTSPVPVVIDSITDIWPGSAETAECAALIGTTVQPGASVTCEFTVTNYAPNAAAGAKVDTVTVKVHDASDPSNTASAADPSTVRGAAPASVLAEVVTQAPPLPRTGADIDAMLAIGLALIAAGALLMLAQRAAPRPIPATARGPVAYNLNPPVIDHDVSLMRRDSSPPGGVWRR